MASRIDPESHAGTDPRGGPDPNRVNMPEGLRRERTPGYGPSGRRAGNRQIAEDDQGAAKG